MLSLDINFSSFLGYKIIKTRLNTFKLCSIIYFTTLKYKVEFFKHTLKLLEMVFILKWKTYQPKFDNKSLMLQIISDASCSIISNGYAR